jgi:DNA-binding CsgD family transcriptional regulator
MRPMSSAALWINIIAFAFMASSIGLTTVIRSRRRHRWVDWYLVYAAGYALWAVIYSLHFFALVYGTSPPPWLGITVGWLRIALSGAIAFALPFMIAALPGVSGSVALRWTAACLGGAFASLGALTRIVPTFVFAAVINVAYNFCLGSLAVLAIVVVRSRKRGSAQALLPPFLWVSVVFYAAAAAAGVVLVIRGRPAPIVSTFAVAAYCLPWAIFMIRRQSAYLAGGEPRSEVPLSFASDFDLTPREREVTEALAAGMTNAQIAEAQFVSIKTIETHIYNIYRKTGVRNRVALVNLLANYGSSSSE